MPRRYIIDVPPEWLSKQLDADGRVRRIKRLAKPLTSTLGENDCRLVMAGLTAGNHETEEPGE